MLTVMKGSLGVRRRGQLSGSCLQLEFNLTDYNIYVLFHDCKKIMKIFQASASLSISDAFYDVIRVVQFVRSIVIREWSLLGTITSRIIQNKTLIETEW